MDQASGRAEAVGPQHGGYNAVHAVPFVEHANVDSHGLCVSIEAGAVGSHCVCVRCAYAGRVPSECLPIITSVGECNHGPAQQSQAEMHCFDDRLVLCLKTRKNMPLGARFGHGCLES